MDGGNMWIVPHNKKLTLTTSQRHRRGADSWLYGRRSSQTDAVTGEMFVSDGADDGSLQRCVRLQNSLPKSRAGTGSQADPPMRQFGVCFLPNFGFTDSLKSHFARCQIKTLLCNQNTKCCFASLLFLLLFLVSVRWSN